MARVFGRWERWHYRRLLTLTALMLALMMRVQTTMFCASPTSWTSHGKSTLLRTSLLPTGGSLRV